MEPPRYHSPFVPRGGRAFKRSTSVLLKYFHVRVKYSYIVPFHSDEKVKIRRYHPIFSPPVSPVP